MGGPTAQLPMSNEIRYKHCLIKADPIELHPYGEWRARVFISWSEGGEQELQHDRLFSSRADAVREAIEIGKQFVDRRVIPNTGLTPDSTDA